MKCPRCQGWMVHDQFSDLRDDTGRLHWEGWRCLNCGAIMDPLVLLHQAMPPAKPFKTRRRSLPPVAA